MRTRLTARLSVLVAVVSIAAGCAAGTGTPLPPPPSLQLRLVTSSTAGPCSAPALTSDGAGTACDRAGTTTYEVGKSLGDVTPTAVQASGQDVAVTFNKADTSTLNDTTSAALNKRLALLLNGKVLSAATVADPVATSTVKLAFATASDATQVADALSGTSPTT